MADLELYGFEWDIRQRAAEAIARGDTVEPRDLEWLAEGYLHLVQLVDAAKDEIATLESDLEDERAPDGLLDWKVNEKSADLLIHVPVTQEIYDELVSASLHVRALDEKDADTSAAVVALMSLESWAALRKIARESLTPSA